MDEPAPMPAFTFNPDGQATITYPDGTVSVNAPRPDDTTAAAMAAEDVSVSATQAADTSSTTFPPKSPDPQPEVTSTVPEPDGGIGTPGPTVSETTAPAGAPARNEPPEWEAAPAGTAASDSVVNPDGSITTRLPDGSTQTVVRLPGGATIVTSTTPPGGHSQPVPPDSPRSRRRRGRSR